MPQNITSMTRREKEKYQKEKEKYEKYLEILKSIKLTEKKT